MGVLMSDLICPYCGKPAELVGGDIVYPHRPDLYAKKFWLCQPCGAYVGCHPDTETPLGRLADADLRKAKMEAHAAFDPLWKSGGLSRSGAYEWLASTLGMSADECHIGMFDLTNCQRVVEACKGRKGPIEVVLAPDWSKVIALCKEHAKEYEEGNNVDSDLPHYIYEAAMNAVFGPGIFDKLIENLPRGFKS